MFDHPPEQQMTSAHDDFTAAAGSDRLDELGGVSGPRRRGSSESDEDATLRPGDAQVAREAVALAQVLAAQVPAQDALRRALAIGLRFLPEARALAVFAPGSEPRSGAFVRVAAAERPNDPASGAGTDPSDTVARHLLARNLPDEIQQRARTMRTAFRVEGVLYLPLWLIAPDGTSGSLGGVLAVHRDKGLDSGARSETQSDATGLTLLAPCCATLLSRLCQSATERRLSASLALLSAVESCLSHLPEDARDPDLVRAMLPDELALLRSAGAALARLLGATRGLILMPWPNSAWNVHELPASATSPRLTADEAPEARAEPSGAKLDSETAAQLIGAIGEKEVLALDRTSPVAGALRAVVSATTGGAADGSFAAGGLLLLAVRAAGQIAGLIALAMPESSGRDLLASAERGAELDVARVELALTGATLASLRLARAGAAQDQARDAFLSLTVHELRSPLTAVKGYAQLLIRQAKRLGVPDQMHQAVAAIDEQSTRMADMISEMHDAVRIRRGDLELHSDLVDLVPLTTQAVQLQSKLFPQHNITLAVPAEPLIGSLDATRVAQVVSALVNNAARFSPGGGDVAVEMSREALEGQPAARLCVRDRGVGVAEPDRERIFDYLYRSPDAQRRRLSGLGLGLFVSHTLAERMGGRLWLEHSHTGEASGSTFCLLLPLRPAE